MNWYAVDPVRRARQVVGDVLVAIWVILALWLAAKVNDAVDAVATEVDAVDGAGTALAGGLSRAGDALDGAPLIGEAVASPFYGAADSAADLGQAGADAAASIDAAGTWLGVVVAVILLLLVLPSYLPGRIAFVRTATALERALRSDTGAEDLLALRALTRQPVERVVRIAPDAAERWRRGDPDVRTRLAAWERYDAGVGPRPQRSDVA